MSKVTANFEVSLPHRIVERYGIKPGDEVHWIAAGKEIRLVPVRRSVSLENREARLRLFEQMTERHLATHPDARGPAAGDRGWKREDLYDRDRTR